MHADDDDDEVEIEIPEPHLTLLEYKREGLPEILVINDALRDFPHGDIFPWHLAVVIEYRDLADNGMPTPAERERIDAIGEEIDAAILAGRTEHGSDNAIFLARSTWNEMRELLYQVHDPEVAHATLQALVDSREWERPWEYRMEHEPEWEQAGAVLGLLRPAGGKNA
jgi:hypothetical protein